MPPMKITIIWPSKKKMFLVQISIKKKRRAGGQFFFFSYLLFPIACFLYTLLLSARDTLERFGQISIKRNIYIILVCTQQQSALHIFDVIRTPS